MVQRLTLALLLAALTSCSGDGASDGGACGRDDDGKLQLQELWRDQDGDGFTDGTTEMVCAGERAPDGYVLEETAIDCDDTSGGVFPGAHDFPNDDVDQDCDGEDTQDLSVLEGFVDNTDPGCSDEVGGTKETPNCTLQAAIQFSRVGGVIRVAKGEYGKLEMPMGRSLIGGYDPSTWTRQPGDRTRLVRGADSGGSTMRLVSGDTGPNTPVIEGLHITGADTQPASTGVWGFDAFLAGGTAIIRDCRIESGGGPEASVPWNVMIMGTHVIIEDSELSTGPTEKEYCRTLLLRSGKLELRRSTITGCARAHDGAGVAIAGGEAIIEDTIIRMDNPSGSVVGIQVTGSGKVFLTGVVVETSGEEATGVQVTGSDEARAEVKNSAFLTVDAALGDSVAALVQEGATLIAANSMFRAGPSSRGDSIALDVDEGAATLVNSLVGADRAGATGTSGAIRTTADGRVTLVANNFYGPALESLVVASPRITELADLDACRWRGCVEARVSTGVAPEFVDFDGGSFELASTSPLIDRGVDPSPFGLVVDRDIDGNPAPLDGDGDRLPMWDVGPAEQ